MCCRAWPAEIDSLHLLGANGQWQQYDLDGASVIGWSFPEAQVHHSPLENFPGARGRQPLIGLLHCDRDQSDSPYAPVSSEALARAPVSAWLLGHIHQPDTLDGRSPDRLSRFGQRAEGQRNRPTRALADRDPGSQKS
jgi:DNA repair protein SbcD/Mre11